MYVYDVHVRIATHLLAIDEEMVVPEWEPAFPNVMITWIV